MSCEIEFFLMDEMNSSLPICPVGKLSMLYILTTKKKKKRKTAVRVSHSCTNKHVISGILTRNNQLDPAIDQIIRLTLLCSIR